MPPVLGQYFPNVSPVIGQPFTEVARSTAEDVEKALDAAHKAKDAWGKTSPAERSNILNKIADRMEAKLSVRSPTTSMSPSASWARSYPGTSRF